MTYPSNFFLTVALTYNSRIPGRAVATWLLYGGQKVVFYGLPCIFLNSDFDYWKSYIWAYSWLIHHILFFKWPKHIALESMAAPLLMNTLRWSKVMFYEVLCIFQGWGAGAGRSRVFLAPWSRSRLKKKQEHEPLGKKVRSRSRSR